MVKPAPTKTNARPPVSLAPVKALSTAVQAEPAAPAGTQPVKPEIAIKPEVAVAKSEPPKPAQSPAPAAPRNEAPVAKAEAAAPVVPVPPVKPAPVVSAAKVPAELTQASLTRSPSAKARMAKSPVAKSPVAKSPVAKSPVGKSSVGKSSVGTSAEAKPVKAKPAPAKPVSVAPAAAGFVPARPAPVKSVDAPVAAKPGAEKPVIGAAAVSAAPAAAVRLVVDQVEKVATSSAKAVEVAAKAAPTPIADLAAVLPKPPEFATLSGATVFSQMLGFARTVGALQASMLDHACAELKATLSEVETLARSDSAADAVALQAKAVRRGYESYAAHLKELAQVASASLRKG